MIYRLLLLSEENDFFRREIKIDSEATFLDLNNFILQTLKYDKHELTSFYVCGEGWEVEQEITLMDMGNSDTSSDTYLMESTRLEDFLEDKGKRLLFVFDMLNERSFSVELMELLPGYLDTPELILSEGKAPEQMSGFDLGDPSLGLGAGIGKDLGFDDDLYGDDLDMGDLDAEGFSELDDLQDY